MLNSQVIRTHCEDFCDCPKTSQILTDVYQNPFRHQILIFKNKNHILQKHNLCNVSYTTKCVVNSNRPGKP